MNGWCATWCQDMRGKAHLAPLTFVHTSKRERDVHKCIGGGRDESSTLHAPYEFYSLESRYPERKVMAPGAGVRGEKKKKTTYCYLLFIYYTLHCNTSCSTIFARLDAGKSNSIKASICTHRNRIIVVSHTRRTVGVQRGSVYGARRWNRVTHTYYTCARNACANHAATYVLCSLFTFIYLFFPDREQLKIVIDLLFNARYVRVLAAHHGEKHRFAGPQRKVFWAKTMCHPSVVYLVLLSVVYRHCVRVIVHCTSGPPIDTARQFFVIPTTHYETLVRTKLKLDVYHDRMSYDFHGKRSSKRCASYCSGATYLRCFDKKGRLQSITFFFHLT